MTTKKQRRAKVAEKRAIYDAESKRLGLEAQRIDREKRERRIEDVEREVKKRDNAQKMRKQHEDVPENLRQAAAVIGEFGYGVQEII